MPFIVVVKIAEWFQYDESPFHEILARHGIQEGDYEVLQRVHPITLQFKELKDDVISDLKSTGLVMVQWVDDD
ncbi:hypothetical protein BDV34DRAFT_219438 [Aspergillus parasiticus]|uniref:Uncharacterized protein n=1 Tax=Aspergillus parasiticus TaxID=5067 RepID=A0A5N6E3G5_ASPPA|nr:hypothetical protein BDV34DRAFT_219438 [Aspergillus parasiticus]